jgi:DNA polymerase elongation subunit (family B)
MLAEYETRSNRPIVYVFPGGDSKRALLRELGKPYFEVKGFEPYFFVKEGGPDPKGAVRIEHGFEGLDGSELKRVVCTVPAEVPIMREHLDHYTADLVFPARYVIDRIPEIPHVEPDVMYLDIEMAAKRGLPDPLNPKDPIVAISTYNSYTRRFDEFAWHPSWTEMTDQTRTLRLYRFGTEKEMLEAFVAHFRRTLPDVLTGWNVVNFDTRCILGRLVANGIPPRYLSPLNSVYLTKDGRPVLKGVVLFDLLVAYKAFKNRDFDSLSLEATAQRELGVGKRPVDKSGIAKLWEERPTELLNYCRTDVELIIRIDRKLRLIDFFQELHEVTGAFLGDLLDLNRRKLHGAHLVETYFMRNSKKILKSHYHGPDLFVTKEGERVGGAMLPPVPGLHRNIISIDDASKYPSIISTFNMSPDTLVQEDPLPEGYEFIHVDQATFERHEDHLGEIPRIIDLLFEKKDEYHRIRSQTEPGSDEYHLADRRRYVFKQILNAFQGTYTQSSSRFFDRRIALDITWAGREMLGIAARKVAEFGYDIVGGHTDGVHFAVKTDKLKEQLRIGTEVSEAVNEAYRTWATEKGVSGPYIQFKNELAQISKTGFFVGKTQYALKLAWKGDAETGKATDEVEINGIQSKRSDHPPILRSTMETFIHEILDGKNPDEAIDVVRGLFTAVARGEVPAIEVAIPKGLGRALGSYKNHSPWDRGAIWSNKNLQTVRFTTGSKPRLLYVKGVPPGLDPTPVVCIENESDILPGIEVDWLRMAETLRQSFRGITEALGFEPKTFLTSQTPLEAWL